MSIPGTNPATAAEFEDYTAQPHVGLPTSPDDKNAPGKIYSRARNALILGLLGIFPLSVLTGIPAIFAGIHALRSIKASEGTLKGRGVAWAGIVLGCVSVIAFAAVLYRVYDG